MEFDWDAENRRHLFEDHPERGLTETDIEYVLSRDSVSIYETPVEEANEERWVDGGFTPDGQLIFVVWTWRGRKIRPIASWKPDPAEARLFEKRRREEYGH